MSANRLLYLATAAALVAQPALSDEAKHRSSSGSSSSAAGARHHSGSSSRSSDSSASRRSDSGSRSAGYGRSAGSSNPSSSTLTDAQRRHPRAGTGTGGRYGYYGHRYPYYGGYGGYYGGGYYRHYYPYYGWGYGYSPYGGIYLNSGWWDAPYYAYGPYAYRGYETGSVRVLVDQPKARVYVDGYYAGEVDDFDGMFQRLHVEPGEHDITIKLEGFRTHNFTVYVPDQGTLKLRWELEPGEGHDGSGDPTLAPPKREARRERDDRYRQDGERRSYEDRDRTENRDRDRERARDTFGSVRFDVRPGDASVYVDGAFRGAARELGSLELPAGEHRIEIVRPGFRTYEREVTVNQGDSVDVSVELEK